MMNRNVLGVVMRSCKKVQLVKPNVFTFSQENGCHTNVIKNALNIGSSFKAMPR
jgi:hypothetical protein